MAALGVPTTRALAVAMTGEVVLREKPQPGAVLTRVAASHIRVGSFQYFAAQEDQEALRLLADFAIARHDPAAAEAENPYVALLAGVIARQAKLIAQWLHIGFIHGVMNTDNMTISGETIDYGPCAFMDAYDPATVLSSIDHGGRYAYANQPRMAQWNLARLAEALLPLLAEQEEAALELAQAALGAFAPAFEATYFDGFARKIGIAERMPEDTALIEDLLRRTGRLAAQFPTSIPTGVGAHLFVVRDAAYGPGHQQRQFRQHVRRGSTSCEVRGVDWTELAALGWPVIEDAYRRQGRPGAITRARWEAFCQAGAGGAGLGVTGCFVGGTLAAFLVHWTWSGARHGLILHRWARFDPQKVSHCLLDAYTTMAMGRDGMRGVTLGRQMVPADRRDQMTGVMKQHAATWSQLPPEVVGETLTLCKRLLAPSMRLTSCEGIVDSSFNRMQGNTCNRLST
jgi:hypothetical protein